MGNKYHAKHTEVDGLKFDSLKESRRWNDLKIRQRIGEIKNLARQIPFKLRAHGQDICVLRMDFTYDEKQGDKWVTVFEDVKGYDGGTPSWKLKSKIFEAQFNVKIRIT